MSRHVLVIGAGVAGLGAALALSRGGHRVTLLERDATPFPADPVEAFEKWDRRGAPQVRHSHAFLARLRNLLRDRAPDVLEALLEAGAEELPISNLLRGEIDDPSPRVGDEDLTLLACRRVTFEWVLHRTVLASPGVAFRDGCTVDGLLQDGQVAGAPRIVGVRLRKPGGAQESLRADLVVDASGRRSPLGRWLAALGASAPAEESEPCGIFYCSRFYRLRPSAEPPARETTIGADLGYLKYAIFHGDSRIFSITFAASPEDRPLRALLRTEPFAVAARHLPAMAPWLEPALSEPITDVHGMDRLRNARRFLVADGRPVAVGLAVLGDAAIHTNPLYGRGCTFALLHAYLLADALVEHGEDPLALALAMEEATQREIVPWYRMAVTQDRDAATVARRLRDGVPPPTPDGRGPVDPQEWMRDVVRRGLVPALRLDATVLRAFLRSLNLLDPPGDLLKNPEVLARVLAVYQKRDEREEPKLGPDREEMIALLQRG